MANVSISDVTAEFCGGKFTLRLTPEAMVNVELATGESFAVVWNRIFNAPVPRLADLSEAFAACALPHGKHTGSSIRSLMSFAEFAPQMLALKTAVTRAAEAAMPPVSDKPAEGGGETNTDPQ